MALTLKQLEDLGFKPSKKTTAFKRKFDTLVYPLNNTDYLYLGYNDLSKTINNKLVWKSFIEPDTGNRIAYVITNIGSTGYNEMKAFLKRTVENSNYKPTPEVQKLLDGENGLGYQTNTMDIFTKLQENNGEDVQESDPVISKIPNIDLSIINGNDKY